MQQFQAIEMIPGSYRYANRTDRTPLHKDFVKLVMEQQFSTVWLMHKDQEARVARLQQTTDEFLDEYRKKHILRKMRVTIDNHKKAQTETAHALVWNVNVDSGSRTSTFTEGKDETDLKHQRTCACQDCDRRRDECISMQENYLLDAGQGPNSQVANAHMATLLGNEMWKHTIQVQQQHVPILQNTPVSLQAETPQAFFVPETPGPSTGGTIICVTSPRQSSDVGTEYNYSDNEDTVTDEEATRDVPIPSSEVLEVYMEGIQGENEDDADKNAAKRARIVPTKLEFP